MSKLKNSVYPRGEGDAFIEEHLTIIPSFSLLVKSTEK